MVFVDEIFLLFIAPPTTLIHQNDLRTPVLPPVPSVDALESQQCRVTLVHAVASAGIERGRRRDARGAQGYAGALCFLLSMLYRNASNGGFVNESKRTCRKDSE